MKPGPRDSFVLDDVAEKAEIIVPRHAEQVTDPDLGESVKDGLGFDSHLATIVDADSGLVCKVTVRNSVDLSGEFPKNAHKTGIG